MGVGPISLFPRNKVPQGSEATVNNAYSFLPGFGRSVLPGALSPAAGAGPLDTGTGNGSAIGAAMARIAGVTLSPAPEAAVRPWKGSNAAHATPPAATERPTAIRLRRSSIPPLGVVLLGRAL